MSPRSGAIKNDVLGMTAVFNSESLSIQQAEFVSFMYGVTAPLVAPFRGIFPDTATGFNVFEASALVAMAIYLLIGWGIVALIKLVSAPRRRRIAP